MDKKTFIKLMEDFLSLKKDIEGVHNALKKLDPEFGGFYLGRSENLIINLFEEMTKDKSEWLSYWLYELEEGRKWHKGCITDKNGKDVKLKTISDLWDVIYNKKI